jgi:hypothetical protein
MVTSMNIMRRVEERKLRFKQRKIRKEGGRRTRRGRGGVTRVFNEIKITTNKSVKRAISGRHGRNKRGVEGEVPRLEVDVKKLKGLMGAGKRGISTKLDIASSNRGKRNITGRIKTEHSRRINNNCPSTININVIPRDTAIGERGESEFLARR